MVLSRLNKGVIVYICDSRGVRDIYDVEGSSAVAGSEPLVVLVISFPCNFFIRSDNCIWFSTFPHRFYYKAFLFLGGYVAIAYKTCTLSYTW